MDVDTFLTEVLLKLLDAAHFWATASIPSHTLQRSMTKEVDYVIDGVAEGRLYIDQYWAIYVHDGRDAINKAPLIWFKNPNDDPRLTLGYAPTRANEFKSFGLSPRDLRKWLNINSALRKAGWREEDLPMQVRWTGVGNVAGSFFFDNDVGMRDFLPIAKKIIQDEFLAWFEISLGTLLRPETNPAYGTIG